MPAVSPEAMQWLSRTIAIVLVMVGPGLLGNWLDDRWGTTYLTATGLVVGMLVSTTTFVIMSKSMIPIARGEPLTDEDFEAPPEDDDENHRDEKND